MKKGLVIATVAMMAVASQAEFIIDVSSSWGIYHQDGSNGMMTSAPGGNAMVELYYVGSNGMFDTLAGAGMQGNVMAGGVGDDVLLTSFMAAVGSEYADFAPVKYQGAYLGTGEVFARIWNDADVSAGGAWFYQGAVLVADDLDPAGSPPPTPFGYDIGGGADAQLANYGQVVIPEPATFGLMGIAGLGMFLARKKTRR